MNFKTYKMARKFLLSLLFLLPVAAASAEDEAETQLVVLTKHDQKVAFALNEHPKVTFTATELQITAGDLIYTYPLADMVRFTYEGVKVPSGITDIETGDKAFSLKGDALVFKSLQANSEVRIYSVDGMLVFSKRVGQAGEYSFPLTGLAAGTYIVNVNGSTYKVMKR